MSISTESYEVVFEQYVAAMRWMSSLGINLVPGRTSHYERVIRRWKNAYKTASAEDGKAVFPDFVSSMTEIFDFVSIHQSFQAIPPEQLGLVIEKLKKAVNGPINAADETVESTAARNFLFEAVVAARSHRPERGIEVILDAKSDTGIRINAKKIWVECKRVTTVDKIEASARKASSQLERVLGREVGSSHRGIVAMDISKILNWGDKIFVARNDGGLLNSIDRMMDRFIAEHSHIWQRVYERRHRKVIGTIVKFSFMASSEARGILVNASQWAMNPRAGIAVTDEQLQKQLVSALGSE